MKELFELLSMRDLFMFAVGSGITIGLLIICFAVHDALWNRRYRRSRRPFDGKYRGGGRL
jgi:hypothetical protein